MKLASVSLGGKIQVAAVVDGSVFPLPPDLIGGEGMLSLIEAGPTRWQTVRQWLDSPSTTAAPLDRVQLLAPIPRPRKNILCLGWNYLEHAQESAAVAGNQAQAPEHPIVFTKAVTAVNAPGGDVVIDDAVTRQLDWEVELGVVIGRRARRVGGREALNCVFGYTVINDLSARDVQFRHKQYFLGKSLDGCCPMGPWIVTADEIPDPQQLDLACRVNGELKQASNTRFQVFPVARLISDLSQILTLEPGDIIATGTPSGVGFARQPPEFLKDGDVVECEIAGIGAIRNRIVVVSAP